MKSELKTAEEFIREKIREKEGITGAMQVLRNYDVSGEDCLRWAHEFAELTKPKWLPIDVNNLPKGEVLATDGVSVLYGKISLSGIVPIVFKSGDWPYEVTHYMNIKLPGEGVKG
jgi:hypothetical protein